MYTITSESLRQGERVHGGPVVGRVLRLLRRLLVEVVHGAQGVHGVQRVAVHAVVLHAVGKMQRGKEDEGGLSNFPPPTPTVFIYLFCK